VLQEGAPVLQQHPHKSGQNFIGQHSIVQLCVKYA
jgi:hypothetical protein